MDKTYVGSVVGLGSAILSSAFSQIDGPSKGRSSKGDTSNDEGVELHFA